jgi:hypothetical protein
LKYTDFQQFSVEEIALDFLQYTESNSKFGIFYSWRLKFKVGAIDHEPVPY